MCTPSPILLLLPGLEGSGDLFDPLVHKLGPRFDIRVARYSAACHTYADAGLHVREMLPACQPCILLAESFSTPLAIELAASLPAAVCAVILCNGFVSNPLSGIESLMALAAAPWFFHIPLTSIAARTFLVGPDASDQLVEAVQRAIAPIPPDTLAARLQAVLRCDARHALGQVKLPILYLHATRDRLVGAAGLHQILGIKPEIPVERIDGPHLLLQREPRRCAEIITRFVDSVLAPTPLDRSAT
jgi:pimeloyl-ACP methyl ester carboxylesterase